MPERPGRWSRTWRIFLGCRCHQGRRGVLSIVPAATATRTRIRSCSDAIAQAAMTPRLGGSLRFCIPLPRQRSVRNAIRPRRVILPNTLRLVRWVDTAARKSINASSATRRIPSKTARKEPVSACTDVFRLVIPASAYVSPTHSRHRTQISRTTDGRRDVDDDPRIVRWNTLRDDEACPRQRASPRSATAKRSIASRGKSRRFRPIWRISSEFGHECSGSADLNG